MRKTNKEIIDLFKTSWTDERVWVNINWNYYLHYDEENNDTSLISLEPTGQIYKLFREIEYKED